MWRGAVWPREGRGCPESRRGRGPQTPFAHARCTPFDLSPRACGDTWHHLALHIAQRQKKVSAVYKSKGNGKVTARRKEKGGRRKDKDKDKDKDKKPVVNPESEVVCWYCHRKGRTTEKDKTKEGTTRERRRTGTRSKSRRHLDTSDNASTNQHD